MSDLYKRIADSLYTMCKENNISKITFVNINVNIESHISSKSLHDYFIGEIPSVIDENTKVVVEMVDSIEEDTALILSLEGYKKDL